jgi:hypothetical protein
MFSCKLSVIESLDKKRFASDVPAIEKYLSYAQFLDRVKHLEKRSLCLVQGKLTGSYNMQVFRPRAYVYRHAHSRSGLLVASLTMGVIITY